jgi:hypothetical protein
LIAHLRKNGVQTVLVTDAAPLANQSHASAGFEHVIEIQRGECDVTQDVLDAATQWLKRHSTKPFFLFADCYGAHDPIQLELEPPESESSEIEQHEQTDPLMLAVSWLDQLAGEFLEWLRVQPFWDYSIIGFTSDMGNVPTRFLADRSAQFDLSEWRTHIPLILRVPGIEPAGRANTLVQPMDLVPTVIEALGVPQLDGLDGASLLPLCRGETQSVRQFATALNPGVAHSVRTSDWLLIEPISSVASHDVSQVLLFAKPEDHWGRDNLAKRYPETVADLRRLLEGQ